MNKVCCALILLLAVVVLPGLARAEKGFYIGTGFGLAVPYSSGDIVDEVNPGAGTSWELLHLGYNFTDRWGVGFQMGSVGGPVDDFMGSDTRWNENYLDLSLRHTSGKDKREGYIELGYGMYRYAFFAEDSHFFSDPAVGYRLALGSNYYLGNFYVGPELSYHWVEFSEGDFDVKHVGEFQSDFDATGNLLLLQLKLGYHRGGK